MIVGYYKNYLYTTNISSAKKKKKKESQYMVSLLETGSDSPIGSDRDRGRDNPVREMTICHPPQREEMNPRTSQLP